MDLQSPLPAKRHKTDEEEVKEEGPEGYICFEGKYDYGDSIFPPDDDEEDALYSTKVMFYLQDDTTDEKIDAYLKKIADSEGFDLDDSPDAFYGSIQPLDLERYEDEYDYIRECLDVAIDKNNADSDKPKLEFVSLKKVNYSGCFGIMYYITFVAEHVLSGKNFTFQAKLLGRLGDRDIQVLTFRPLYKSTGGVSDVDFQSHFIEWEKRRGTIFGNCGAKMD
ncbi:hypothetical protein Tsubulata_024328 [Turnera subulata]|uniref:Cystatin domain-containing protein n=1 Tax=Turnera subulata TaxID=218843 RepID=A0A9Q0F865_9ROSI|nr:hypothetical protein Tsubulata_024328 [Turnera subulata]